MKLFNLYVKLRNFYVNNFFVTVLCLKQNDIFIYLDNNYLICRYLLLLIPFYFVKYFASKYNYELIYKIDGVYGITNIKDNHIIPFIISCVVINDTSSLNISDDIRLYNSSIPLYFFINMCTLHDYKLIKLNYLIKGIKKEKEINLNNIDTKKYLIYNLFDN
jgi:hypothetical protein